MNGVPYATVYQIRLCVGARVECEEIEEGNVELFSDQNVSKLFYILENKKLAEN